MKQHQINIGRDKFYRFLRAYNLLVPRTKRHFITTNSKHQFYKHKNLVKDKDPVRAEQLWVSDITYIKTQKGHSYLALVTDAYSKQIMGYKLASHMKVSLCTDALKMAIKNRKYPNQKLIHHSDRGIQYCNPGYTEFAEQNGLTLSMTEQYDPYENAVAERVNGILKGEFDIADGFINEAQAQREIKNVINIYNNKRPHISCDYVTPVLAHKQQKHKPKFYSRLLTNKQILTKEKRSKKEKAIQNNINFKS